MVEMALPLQKFKVFNPSEEGNLLTGIKSNNMNPVDSCESSAFSGLHCFFFKVLLSQSIAFFLVPFSEYKDILKCLKDY